MHILGIFLVEKNQISGGQEIISNLEAFRYEIFQKRILRNRHWSKAEQSRRKRIARDVVTCALIEPNSKFQKRKTAARSWLFWLREMDGVLGRDYFLFSVFKHITLNSRGSDK